MTPTKLLKHGKRSVALAFTLAGALLLGACGSAAGAVELESAQAQLTAAQAELNTLLYALQSVEQIEVPEAEEADPVMEISRTESDLVGIWDNPDIPTIRVVLSPDGTGSYQFNQNGGWEIDTTWLWHADGSFTDHNDGGLWAAGAMIIDNQLFLKQNLQRTVPVSSDPESGSPIGTWANVGSPGIVEYDFHEDGTVTHWVSDFQWTPDGELPGRGMGSRWALAGGELHTFSTWGPWYRSNESGDVAESLAVGRFEFKDQTDIWQSWMLNQVLPESMSTYSAIYDGNLVWGNFGDEGVLVHFEDQFSIERAEIVSDFTLVLFARPDSNTLANSVWEVIYFEEDRFMNLFFRIEHLTIINADTNNVMFSHQIHHGHPEIGVSSLAELRAHLGLD